jgi:membrane protein DedA with SNARE-associated domain
LGKFIGPLRCVVPLLAGMFQMNLLLFFILESISAPLWAISLTFTGYFFYKSYSAFQAYLGLSAIFGMFSTTIIVGAILWVRNRYKKKKVSHQSTSI